MLEDLTFERPVGAAADSKELEYITALHQTTDDEDETYRDGSIDGKATKGVELIQSCSMWRH